MSPIWLTPFIIVAGARTDSRHYPQERGARFAEGGGRFTGMPRMTLRLRYLTLKLRALCWVLRRLRAGRSFDQLN